MREAFEIYAVLWKRAQAEGALVLYKGASPAGEAGWFDAPHRTGELPSITIVRSHYIQVDEPHEGRNDGGPVDIPSELITLAHEYGHFRSWLCETPRPQWETYLKAAKARDKAYGLDMAGEFKVIPTWTSRLPDAQKQLILEEEGKAWSIGRRVLTELDFEAWAAYEKGERLGLHNHRYRLGLDGAWPEDSGQ